MKSTADLSQTLPVLIPKQAGTFGILKASAIVLLRQEDGLHRIYYEGNAYGADNLNDIHGRLQVAASRALSRAPTTAFFGLSEDDLKEHFVEIGTYQYATNTLMVNCLARNNWSQWLESAETCVN